MNAVAAPTLRLFSPTDAPQRRNHRSKRLPDFLREEELQALFAAAHERWQETGSARHVYLYQHASRGPFYYLQWTCPETGKLLHKNTATTDLDAAEQMRCDLENELRIEPRVTTQHRWRLARQRDYVMLLTAFYCGLRIQELCNLCVQDIDLDGRLLFVRQGKGAKDGTVPIPTPLYQPLRDWIGDRVDGVLFRDPRGQHIDQSHFRVTLKAIAKRAGITRRVHPHLCRHSFATHLLRNGADIYEVMRLLRHANLGATLYYLHLVPGRLAAASELLGKVVSP